LLRRGKQDEQDEIKHPASRLRGRSRYGAAKARPQEPEGRTKETKGKETARYAEYAKDLTAEQLMITEEGRSSQVSKNREDSSTNSTDKHATVRLPTERAGVDLFALGSELPDTNKSTPAASLCEARMPEHNAFLRFLCLFVAIPVSVLSV
jgi:hypothetical protein